MELVGIFFEYAVLYAALIVVVLNRGPVGAVAMKFVWFLASFQASTDDWSAWHAQPAILATIVVGALALYAYWAVTPAARRAQ